MASNSPSMLHVFVDASSGAVGALIAAILLYPIDILKTQRQIRHVTTLTQPKTSLWSVIARMYHQKGVQGFYAGLQSKILHTAIANFAYFYWFSLLRKLAEKRKKALSVSAKLSIAMIAGALNMSMTLPLEMINTRAQVASIEKADSEKKESESKGMQALCRDIYIENGWKGFWRGYFPALLLTMNPSIHYTIFDNLKDTLLRYKQSTRAKSKAMASLTAMEAFVLAAIAKSIATIVTYPLIRAKVLMQAEKASATETSTDNPSLSMIPILRKMYREEGVVGCYNGCSAQLLNTVLKSAILLMSKEKIAFFAMKFVHLLSETDEPCAIPQPS